MLKFILLGILLVAILLLLEILLPKLKFKFRLLKEEINKKQKRENFRKHMKELEIK